MWNIFFLICNLEPMTMTKLVRETTALIDFCDFGSIVDWSNLLQNVKNHWPRGLISGGSTATTSLSKSGNLTLGFAKISSGKIQTRNKDFMTRKWSLLKLDTQKAMKECYKIYIIHLCVFKDSYTTIIIKYPDRTFN